MKIKKTLFLVAFFVILGWCNLQAMVQRWVEITADAGITVTNMVAFKAPQVSSVVLRPETFGDYVVGLSYPPTLALVLAMFSLAVYALMVLPRRVDSWWNSWHLHRHHDHQHKFA